MFIRETKKSNSKSSSSKVFFQYVLVQGSRINGVSRQRNVLYLGSQKFLSDKDLRRNISKALEEKIYGQLCIDQTKSYYDNLNDEFKKHVDQWYEKYLKKEKEEHHQPLSKPADQKSANFEEIDTSTVDTDRCREVGAEWLCLNVAKELKIDNFLSSKGFTKSEAELALLSIISRAVFPASEHKTAQLLEQNSALWELFETMKSAPNRFGLYRMAEKLSAHFDAFTDHVYQNTMDIFSLQDTLMIYDLTNTYFEGRKLGSILAKFGRSKEKRSDCRLFSFSAVVNKYGFLRYSKIDRGNISDSSTLIEMINEMKKKSKTSQLEKVVVIDAGIATEKNLEVLRENGQKYVCVSPTRLKDYEDYTSEQMTEIRDKRKNKIEVKLLDPTGKPDKWLLVKSEMKKNKEQSMLTRAEQVFEEKLTAIDQGIHKKRGTKKINKVWERIGRVKESCKKVHTNYEIIVNQDKKGNAVQMSWSKKDSSTNKRSGVYFIRTNLEGMSDENIWNIYNTIREVESTFRCLKTDLRIRPIFHQKDKYSTAHIHLGLMAYQLVAAIRHQLKQNNTNHDWTNIVRIMSSQKMNTIKMKMKTKEVHIRKPSSPEKHTAHIYQIMGINKLPKSIKKYVVYH